jgi:transposase-like protein
MKNKRRIHSAEFKARIALEALKGLKTVQQIAAENEVHPTQVTQWKSHMIEGASEVFEQGRGRATQEQATQIREERLERKIGQLVVEVDWLSKKCKELGIDP